jgi:hypothetical protein
MTERTITFEMTDDQAKAIDAVARWLGVSSDTLLIRAVGKGLESIIKDSMWPGLTAQADQPQPQLLPWPLPKLGLAKGLPL